MTTAFHAPAGATDLPLEDIPEVLTQGGDWDDVLHEIEAITSERIVVNLGPVHPATHGVLRLILELDGEKVRETRIDTGYLHTGIEKNMEYRTWTQGVAYCTRMDYVAPFFQEAAYCLGVEKLLGIEEDIPERASLIRILMMELCRIASHLVAIGSTGNEMGATTIMTIGFRAREEILRVFERITGLRMNHEYIRPGGVVQDIGEGTTDYIRERLRRARKDIGELQDILVENPIFKKRLCDVAVMPLSGLMALGSTGPGVRAAGLPLDLRKSQPYCGYENFEFDIPTRDKSDVYNRTMVRFDECYESMRIIWQVLDKLDQCDGAPTMVADPEIAWPARLAVATDGQGNSFEHVHGGVHGVPHPPLQARHGGLPRARRPGLPDRRAREGHPGCPPRLRRWYAPVPRALPRPLLREPSITGHDDRGRPAGRRGRRTGRYRPRSRRR